MGIKRFRGVVSLDSARAYDVVLKLLMYTCQHARFFTCMQAFMVVVSLVVSLVACSGAKWINSDARRCMIDAMGSMFTARAVCIRCRHA